MEKYWGGHGGTDTATHKNRNLIFKSQKYEEDPRVEYTYKYN